MAYHLRKVQTRLRWSLMACLPQIHSACPFTWRPVMAFPSYTWSCSADPETGNGCGAWAMREHRFTEPWCLLFLGWFMPCSLPGTSQVRFHRCLARSLRGSVSSWPPSQPPPHLVPESENPWPTAQLLLLRGCLFPWLLYYCCSKIQCTFLKLERVKVSSPQH